MGSYVPATADETRAMLEACGLASEDELFSLVPDEARIEALDIPAGVSELEALAHMEDLASRNLVFRDVFRGAGAYRHHIPAIVRHVTSREEFLTAYTPYQAEISQGVLQSIYEYQSQVCELFGMDVANASVYDGATAAAEGCLMCLDRKRGRVVAAGTVNPQVLETLRTYCENRDVPLDIVDGTDDLALDASALAKTLGDDVAAVLVQSPNYYGVIEDVPAIVEAAHAAGAKVVMSVNPISMGLLKTPGELGCDVAVAEGQPLGLPLAFGGPYLGIMCARSELMRKLPGRIVGETADAQGRRAFVLTLQAREQHIRREKASSNICSNEALCAMTASVYLAAMGPTGIAQVAQSCAAHARYLAAGLADLGMPLRSSRPFFNEFLTEAPEGMGADELLGALEERSILGGLPVADGILWATTELNDRASCDRLLAAVREVLGR